MEKNISIKEWLTKFEKKNKNFVSPVILLNSLKINVGESEYSQNIPSFFEVFLDEKSSYLINEYYNGNSLVKEKIYEKNLFEFYFYVIQRFTR
jgi:serine/threonine protein kinase